MRRARLLTLAATALGYGAQWITEWYGYSEGVRRALGLAENERVAVLYQDDPLGLDVTHQRDHRRKPALRARLEDRLARRGERP